MFIYHLHGKYEDEMCEQEACFFAQPGGLSVCSRMESSFFALVLKITCFGAVICRMMSAWKHNKVVFLRGSIALMLNSYV